MLDHPPDRKLQEDNANCFSIHPLHPQRTVHSSQSVSTMAKAPPSSSAKKGGGGKDAAAAASGKSRSSASEVNKEKSKSKDAKKTSMATTTMSRKGPSISTASNDAPAVKSVLKESRPVPSFNLVQEQDFPRGAPPTTKASSKTANKLHEQPLEKGLFEVSRSYLRVCVQIR